MSELKSYDKAVEELNQIIAEMEEGEIGIDDLSEKVKRASQLIEFCQKKLASTEADVKEILEKMDRNEEDQ